MRILQLTKHYPPYQGGIESVTFDLTEGLNQNGITCDVICANDQLKTREEQVGIYSVLRAASFGKLFSTSISPQLIHQFRKKCQQYDIIHVHFPDPMAAMAVYFARPKAKLVIHWHSDIIKQKQLLKLFMPLQEWILKRADVIVGTSEKYTRESDQLAKFQDKAIAIPIGIDPRRLILDPEKAKEIQEGFPDRKIIFALGRLVYYKGFEYLVEAGRYLPDDVVLLIGGEGPLKIQLQQKIAKEGLAHKVKMLGRIPHTELGSYFQACKLFCLPSIEKSEAFGVVQLEAMMLGKPVISTDIPGSGVGWVNRDSYSGYVVPLKDPKALAARIADGLANYERMSKQAIERFNSIFTADRMVNSFIRLYNDLNNR